MSNCWRYTCKLCVIGAMLVASVSSVADTDPSSATTVFSKSVDLERCSRARERSEADLIGDLSSAEPLYRSSAARELGRRKAASAAPELRKLLADPEPFVQLAAASSLADLGEESALQVLRDFVDAAGSDKILAQRASLALAERGHETDLVWTVLQDKCWVYRQQAVWALSRLTNEASRNRAFEIAVRDPEKRFD